MLCPSDSYNRVAMNGSHGKNTSGLGDNWARGNYAANGDLDYMQAGAAGGPNDRSWQNPAMRGIMGVNCSLRAASVTDGLSNTVLVGEIRAGLTDYDCRGVWALSGAGPSALFGLGASDDIGPNCPLEDSDDMANCSQLRTAYGEAASSDQSKFFALSTMGMPCSYNSMGNSNGNTQATVRSMHRSGAYVCMADGSTHWLSDFINLQVFTYLFASGDGQVISANQW